MTSDRPIGEVAPVQTGLAFKSGWFVDDGVRLLRNVNIHQGYIDWSDTVSVGPDTGGRFSSFSLREGDIVLTLDRPIVANGLKVARITATDLPALLNQRVARFIVDAERVDADYFYAFLRSPRFSDAIRGHDQSLGVPHISPSQVERVELPVPPLANQRATADALNHALACVASAAKAAEDRLAVAEALPAAFLREVFEGPEASKWDIRPLGEMVQGDGQYGTSQRSNGEGRGLAVLGMPHIHQGRIRWQNVSFADLSPEDLERYRLQVGDILFNRTNSAELVGKTAIFDGAREAVFASYLIRYRALNGVADPHFICAYINSHSGRSYIERHMVRAVGQVNISASTMHKMPLPCPPVEEQTRVTGELSRHFASAESLTVRCREELAAIRALPASLLRAAFIGGS